MKNKLIISTLILIVGGLFTKIFGMFIRIITTRLIGINGMSIYMLVMPTFSLFMTLSQMSLPTAISKLVSEDKYNNKKLVLGIVPIIVLINIFYMLLIIFLAYPISHYLLKSESCFLPILSIAIVLPFDALSNLLRGYFFGKQKMLPHVISHIFEQIIRLTLIIIFIPTLIKKSLIYAVSFLIGVNFISELSSILILSMFIPNKNKINKKDFKYNKSNLKDILCISIPTTASRLIGNIGMFIEPIIIQITFNKLNYNYAYVQNEYAIITGYVLPLLLLPGFFTGAISSALIPEISKNFANSNFENVKRKLKTGIILSLIIGIPFTLILFIFPKTLLRLFYNTYDGYNYLKLAAPFFILYYIEGPLSSCLQAINKSKIVMIDNIIGIVLKLIALYLLPFLNFGTLSIIIATVIYMTVVTLRHTFYLSKKIKKIENN